MTAENTAEFELLRARVVALEAACLEAQRLYADAQNSLDTLIGYAPEAIVLLDIETGRSGAGGTGCD